MKPAFWGLCVNETCEEREKIFEGMLNIFAEIQKIFEEMQTFSGEMWKISRETARISVSLLGQAVAVVFAALAPGQGNQWSGPKAAAGWQACTWVKIQTFAFSVQCFQVEKQLVVFCMLMILP